MADQVTPRFLTSQLLVFSSRQSDPEIVVEHFGRKSATDPDVIILTDEKSIKIEHIRQLQQQLSTQPQTEQGRLVIICPAEKITRPAQQALLKLVEEPPPRTQIVLAANSKQGVLATIQSRCALVYFQNTPDISQKSVAEPSLIAQISALTTTKQKVEFIQLLPSKREELVEILLAELHRPLPQENFQEGLRFRQQLIVVLEALQGNVSPGLCLEKWIL